jgi:alpha-tubulin suppressor-like RCC1 family protein
MTDGTIYGTGLNSSGQLGLGNLNNPIVSLTLMPNTTGLTPKAIACGENHTIVLMTDGSIYGVGANVYGELADLPPISTSLTLMTNSTGLTPKAIACGGYHTIVLMTDGSLYGTGLNSSGQLIDVPALVPYASSLTLMTNSTGLTPKAITCGDNYTIVLMTDNTIYGGGYNINGQLGIGNYTNQSSFTSMTNYTGLTPKAIACGGFHTIVLMTDGSLYGTGSNYGGILTNLPYQSSSLTLMTNSTDKTPHSILAGHIQTIVLMTDGTIYGAGDNYEGQLGLGTTTRAYSLQLVPNLTSVNKLAGSSISISAISGDINNGSIVCFKEDSLILTDKGYQPIQQLRKGDFVKTSMNGVMPIHMIGKREMYHAAVTERVKDQLYVCTSDEYPGVFEPLVITGCHSILVPKFTSEEERLKTIKVNGNIYVTDKKYRLPACVDERAKVYETPGTYTIYHIALEHSDYYMNYGIYANGLLVETCSKRYLKELSNMEII